MLCQIKLRDHLTLNNRLNNKCFFFLSNHLIRAIFLVNHAVNESNCLQRSYARKCVQLRRFEFKHDTPNGACVSDMMYFKTCKVSSEETLLFTTRKRLDVLGAELKENQLYLIYLACNSISFSAYMVISSCSMYLQGFKWLKAHQKGCQDILTLIGIYT